MKFPHFEFDLWPRPKKEEPPRDSFDMERDGHIVVGFFLSLFDAAMKAKAQEEEEERKRQRQREYEEWEEEEEENRRRWLAEEEEERERRRRLAEEAEEEEGW